MEYDVSIIIPVYNAENYIEKCIKSLINQTYKFLEIIFVNDGSTDSSLQILKKYRLEYNNIIILEQKNKGQGEARNLGIKNARGRFITFADSDDWLSDEYIEVLYKDIIDNNADISICNMAKVIEKSEIEIKSSKFPFKELNREEAIKQILLDKELKSYPWGKMYKKDLFEKNKITFPQRMFYEDLAIIIKLFFYAEKIVLNNQYCYYYLQTSRSSTRTPNPKNIDDRLSALTMIKDFLIANEQLKNYKNEFIHFCLYHLYLMARQVVLWNIKIEYNNLIASIEQLLNEKCLNEEIINKTYLSKEQKKELKILINKQKMYRMQVTINRIKSKVINRVL